jgi:hypothetical protein
MSAGLLTGTRVFLRVAVPAPTYALGLQHPKPGVHGPGQLSPR